MKINFKHAILACAALMMGFTSCVTGNEGGDTEAPDGTETYAAFNFSFPATTRATDDGIAAESAVSTVDIFIFKNGSREALVQLTDADFTPSGTTYTATKSIKTTVGAKSIYVGVNLPAGFASTLTNVSALAAAQDVTITNGNLSLISYNGGDVKNIAMFSKTPATPTLVAVAGTDPAPGTLPAANKVSISVERMVAKAAVSESQNLKKNLDNYASFSTIQFKVAGLLNKTYIGQNIVGGTVQTPDWAHGTTVNTGFYNENTNGTYMTVNAYGLATDAATFKAQYAPENTNQPTPREGETTRVVIKSNVQPTKVWKYTANNGAAYSDWQPADNAAPANTTFYMLETVSGTTYFFVYADDATASTEISKFIAAYMAQSSVSGTIAQNFNKHRNSGESKTGDDQYVTKYTGGLCYWKVWMNVKGDSDGMGGATAKANVGQTHRNDFYHVTIDNITKIGDGTEGVDTEEEIYDDDAFLSVTMEVKKWNYVANGVDL